MKFSHTDFPIDFMAAYIDIDRNVFQKKSHLKTDGLDDFATDFPPPPGMLD